MGGGSAPLHQTTAVFIQQDEDTEAGFDNKQPLRLPVAVSGSDGKQAATRQDVTIRRVAVATEQSGAEWVLCAPIMHRWNQPFRQGHKNVRLTSSIKLNRKWVTISWLTDDHQKHLSLPLLVANS